VIDMGGKIALAIAVALSGCGGQRDARAPASAVAATATAGAGAETSAGVGAAGAGGERGVVLFLGTSLTAGLGVGAESAYPAVIQALIDSAGLRFRVVNAELSGETSAGGLRRLEWSLQEPVSVLVVELGANDGLRGLSVDALRRNLQTIIERTRERYPAAGIVIAGMEAPPNMGGPYTRAFHAVYPEVAKQYGAALVPFLLEGVAGDPGLNQADRIHPTVEGQRLVARNVWRVLGPLLEKRAASNP